MTLRLAPADVVSQSTSPLLRIADWWKRCRLGDIAEVTNGGAFPSARFNTNGDGLPLIRIRDVGQPKASTYYDGEYKTRHLVETGDLLIGMDGDFRIARWRAGQALLNQRVCRLRVYNSDLYSDRFLEYVLQPYLDEIHKVTSAVTVKHLSSRTVQQLPIPLSPRDEQQRIVGAVEEHFSRLDAAEATLNKTLERLKTLRRSILAEAFSGRLVPQDPNDEPASVLLERITASQPTKPKQQKTKRVAGSSQTTQRADPGVGGVMSRLSNGWVTVQLGDVFKIVGGSTPRTDNPDYWGGDIPWLTPDDLSKHDGVMVSRGRRSITEAGFASTSTHLLPKDSILFSSRAPIGYTAIAANPLCTNQGFKSLIPPVGVESRYVYWFLRHATSAIREFGSGTTFKELSKKRMAAIPFVLAPTLEQIRIVAAVEEHFSRLDIAEAILEKALERLKTLRRSILAEAFSGRLVPQDLNDEPASKLLERITASQPTKPKRRSKPKRRKTTA